MTAITQHMPAADGFKQRSHGSVHVVQGSDKLSGSQIKSEHGRERALARRTQSNNMQMLTMHHSRA